MLLKYSVTAPNWFANKCVLCFCQYWADHGDLLTRWQCIVRKHVRLPRARQLKLHQKRTYGTFDPLIVGVFETGYKAFTMSVLFQKLLAFFVALTCRQNICRTVRIASHEIGQEKEILLWFNSPRPGNPASDLKQCKTHPSAKLCNVAHDEARWS